MVIIICIYHYFPWLPLGFYFIYPYLVDYKLNEFNTSNIILLIWSHNGSMYIHIHEYEFNT